MYFLENTFRDYPWGSRSAISHLLGREASGAPEAEMWIGAHPTAPSLAVLPEGRMALDELIAADPEALLGKETNAVYGQLPFLAKLLAADKPLSVQVHPNPAQAAAGLAAEDAAGVPRDAFHRNYRDSQHKPEMLFALTDFVALSGFRPVQESAGLFTTLATALTGAASRTAEHVASLLLTQGLRAAFGYLLDAGTPVSDLAAAAPALVAADPVLAAEPALAELISLASHYPSDPGVVVSLLLNLVRLAPGEAIYLDAGNVHAYLRGLGVEVMANSDNVLRGGLTSKHIDVPELMGTVDFNPIGVPRLRSRTTDLGQETYVPPFAEFALQRIEIPAVVDDTSMADADVPLLQNGPVLVICVQGELLLDSPYSDARVARGESVFIGADEAPVMARRSGSAGALAFVVTTGSSG
ncbi:mannose-6-phosphate isomerase, class I [Paeniglutamicibacter cryotolerans]|uniref:mannose-6-phosphate isomerase n=1 Tax=Paeniglutamicibacter cryotolerans TaxID=670079 RepID=A0A839QRQ7_9MICC|nr:mannose-6-phosphate isomerase, class I [Paeniglutamicibacter cryotolerans]MBB2995942.1 mannose-6-phosphate isomerase [Paeniglutamicibacter cryotolerans]